MALSSEPKMKLNLKSGFSMSSQPTPSPPVGLKINHGKPNYTINKGVSRNGSIRINETTNQGNPFGIVLKKTASPITPPTTPTTETVTNGNGNGNVSPPISPKPVVISRTFSTPTRTTPINPWTPTTNGPKEASQVILRSTSRASNYSNGSQNGDDEEPEFLRAHRKMAAKISNVDYEEINRNRNSYTEIMNVSSPRITSSPSVPEVESVPEVDVASVEVIEKNDKPIVEKVVEEVKCNGNVEEHVEECNGKIEEHVQEEVKCNGDVEKEVEQPTLSFADQLNELIAKGPSSPQSVEEELKKQIDETIEEAVQEVEKQSLVDENGNTLPDDLAKLKFDIQQDQQDITVTTTVVH
ncbi:hypothetical protein ACFFRR_008377 [Megaselia abdita]